MTLGSPQISVAASGRDLYRVVVTDRRGETSHELTVTAEDVARYAPGSTPEHSGNWSLQSDSL